MNRMVYVVLERLEGDTTVYLYTNREMAYEKLKDLVEDLGPGYDRDPVDHSRDVENFGRGDLERVYLYDDDGRELSCFKVKLESANE